MTDKLSDSDESFEILRDIKPYSFGPLGKGVTDSINCEELAVATTDVDPEQTPVPPTPDPGPQQRVRMVCICLCWYQFNC